MCDCDHCARGGERYTEDHRAACEARAIAALATDQARTTYLDLVRTKRGEASYSALRRAVWQKIRNPTPPVVVVDGEPSAGQPTQVDGSFWGAPIEGNSNPYEPLGCVV
jgi:hypothetical protein